MSSLAPRSTLAGVEEQAHELRVPVLRGQHERTMPAFGIGCREQPPCIGEPPQPGCRGNVIDARAALNESLARLAPLFGC